MSTTTIQNVVTDSSGQPVQSALVRITLQTSLGGLNIAGVTADSSVTRPTVRHTDDAGHWSADLVPNDEVLHPGGTYYLVEEAGYQTAVIVPTGGGTYELSNVVTGPQPAPAGQYVLAPATIALARNGAAVANRPTVNLIQGAGIGITVVDNPGAKRVDVTLTGAGGGGGGAAVETVNGLEPDVDGNVVLIASNVGADATGTAAGLVATEAAARASADTTLANAINAEATARASAVSGEASARSSADTTLTSAMSAEATTRAAADTTLTTAVNARLVAASNLTDLASPSAARTALGLGTAALQNAGAFDAAGAAATVSGASAQRASNLSDLGSAVTARTNLGLDPLLAAKADLVGGVIPTAQLPAIAISEFLGTVASQSAMLALTGQLGDWAIRSDLGATWIITGSNPTQLASWTQLAYPAAPVTTVNGQTGTVVLAAADVSAAPASRTVGAGTGLTGGGALTADVSLAVAYGTASGTAAQGNDGRITGSAQKASNLSDLASASTARGNLGLGGAAVLAVGTSTGTVAAGDDSRITGSAQKSSNLSDLGSAGTARSNLGLGNAAVLAVGTTVGTVAAGDDSRLSDARTPTAHASTHNSGGADAIIVAEAQVTGLVADLAAKAPLAAPVFTGAATAVDLVQSGRHVVTADALTDGATINTDASLGNHFRVTLGGNRTLASPTNPAADQKVMWELIQDGTGSRTITLGAKFALGADISAITLSTGAGKRDFLGAVYNATADLWYVIAFVTGY